jgi:hypothetical protein
VFRVDPTGRITERGVNRFISALEKLAAASGGRRHFAWLHPTINQRVEFLSGIELETTPEALRFERRLRNLGRLLVATIAVAATATRVWARACRHASQGITAPPRASRGGA